MLGIINKIDRKNQKTFRAFVSDREFKFFEEFINEAKKNVQPGETITRGSFVKAVILDAIGYKDGDQ